MFPPKINPAKTISYKAPGRHLAAGLKQHPWPFFVAGVFSMAAKQSSSPLEFPL